MRVLLTKLSNGDGDYVTVSTVQLSMFYSGEYETMVFPKESMLELECSRYDTEAAARDGHAMTVSRWQSAYPIATENPEEW
jgi:hypothetical protein